MRVRRPPFLCSRDGWCRFADGSFAYRFLGKRAGRSLERTNERLVELKRKYDPKHLFSGSHLLAPPNGCLAWWCACRMNDLHYEGIWRAHENSGGYGGSVENIRKDVSLQHVGAWLYFENRMLMYMQYY